MTLTLADSNDTLRMADRRCAQTTKGRSSTRPYSALVPDDSVSLEGFEPCLRLLLLSLRFAHLTSFERRDPAAVEAAFRTSHKQILRAGILELLRLATETIIASTVSRRQHNPASSAEMAEMATKQAESLLRNAPKMTCDVDQVINQARTLSQLELYQFMARELGYRARIVILRLRFLLDMLREIGLAGTITFDRTSCTFTYGRTVLTDSVVHESTTAHEFEVTRVGTIFHRRVHTTATTVDKCVEKRRVLQAIRHQLDYWQSHPAKQGSIPLPDHVRALVENCPGFADPRCITGQLTDYQVQEQELGRSREASSETIYGSRTKRRLNRETLRWVGSAATAALGFALSALTPVVDPALVVGDGSYVLTGWLPEDLPVHRRYRI